MEKTSTAINVMKTKQKRLPRVLDRRTKEYKRWLYGCCAAAEANCHPPIVKKVSYEK